MGNLDLQKGELPKLLCIVFYLEKTGIPGSGKPTAIERCRNQQSIVTETYCEVNSKRGPTAGAFGLGFCCLWY